MKRRQMYSSGARAGSTVTREGHEMNLGRGTVVYGVGLATACVLLAAGVYAQARPSGQPGEQKPQLSEDVFKNVRVLRGIPVKEFMGSMGFFSASLGLNCTDCHGGASASNCANYAIDRGANGRRGRDVNL